MTASIAAPIGADLGLDQPVARNRARTRRTSATKQKRGKTRSKTGTRERATPRTSEILRRLLEDKSRDSLTIEEIVSELGPRSLPTSLMIFTIPAGITYSIARPFCRRGHSYRIISYQMFRGKEEISLPRWILDRSVPRSAFKSLCNHDSTFFGKGGRKSPAALALGVQSSRDNLLPYGGLVFPSR